MFFYLIESFDIYLKPLENYNFSSFLGSSFFNFFNILFHEIFFYKVRFLVFLILIHAIIIFYINFKTVQKTILISSFIYGFNNSLKDVLSFKKINFLN